MLTAKHAEYTKAGFPDFSFAFSAYFAVKTGSFSRSRSREKDGQFIATPRRR
jgi:hypothetical protein